LQTCAEVLDCLQRAADESGYQVERLLECTGTDHDRNTRLEGHVCVPSGSDFNQVRREI
jgi:hypothetical protein